MRLVSLKQSHLFKNIKLEYLKSMMWSRFSLTTHNMNMWDCGRWKMVETFDVPQP